jgi:hypothetical protein
MSAREKSDLPEVAEKRANKAIPRLQSRVAVSISRAVCAAHFAVPGRMTSMTLDFAGTPDARLKV